MRWQDELRRRIEAMTEADWELEAAMHGDRLEWTGFIIPCSCRFIARNLAGILAATGRVNDKELAGRLAGMVMLLGMRTSGDHGQLNFGVRRYQPWNRFPNPLGGFSDLPCYLSFDLDSLEETYLDLPPLL